MASGCASELGSVLPDFNYSIIIGVRLATLAYQFWIASGLVPCLVQLGSDLVPLGSRRRHFQFWIATGLVPCLAQLGSDWVARLSSTDSSDQEDSKDRSSAFF